jgi:glycosyltransferase involved in cell wall biosynthesis
MAGMNARPPRLAVMLLRGLDHFIPDLLHALPGDGGPETRAFHVDGAPSLAAALAWADDPARDAVWFEFCWPPLPELIARTDFGGRRVILRIHRIEAYETGHARAAPWGKIDDLIVVSGDMAGVVLATCPIDPARTRVHVVHNGVDAGRFPLAAPPSDRFRIGWCGNLILRKNPALALEILHRLRRQDVRWHLHVAGAAGDRVAVESFRHLARALDLEGAVTMAGAVPAAAMPAWHARNAVLLSTSLHESFGYAIAEAAAIGCGIAVLDHPGAAEFWPAETRFASADRGAALVRAAAGGWGAWRGLVEARYGLAAQAAAIRRILAPGAAEPAAPAFALS